MGKEPVELDLRIERDSSLIRGSISTAGQPPFQFIGWLQLISLIEQATRQDANTTPKGASS